MHDAFTENNMDINKNIMNYNHILKQLVLCNIIVYNNTFLFQQREYTLYGEI